MNKHRIGPNVDESGALLCSACQLPLPLQLAESNERGMSCRCAGCGAEYWGNIDADRALEFASNIAPVDSEVDDQTLETLLPPNAVAALISELLENFEGPERRASVRRRITMGVSAQPVDEQFRPTGKSFLAITRNISRGGLSLIHNRPISAPYLILELPAIKGSHVRTRLQVLRCQRCENFHEITGQFVVANQDTNLLQTRDVKLSPSAWQALDTVARQLRRTPDCIIQSLVLSERSQARHCLSRYLSDMAEQEKERALS